MAEENKDSSKAQDTGSPKAGRRQTKTVHEIPDDLNDKHELYRLFTLNLETARMTLAPILANLFRVKAVGQEKVPTDEGAILVCNHASYIDPVLLGLYFPREVTFLAMSNLFTLRERFNKLYNEIGTITGMPFVWSLGKPMFEVFSSLVGDGLKTQLLEWQAVPVVRNFRGDSAKDAMKYYDDLQKQMISLVDDNRIVAIFPEGGRTRSGDLLEFKGMAAQLAVESGKSVIPSALKGTYGALEPENLATGKTFTSDIEYRIGDPITSKDFPMRPGKKAKAKALTELIRKRVQELLED